MERLSRPPLRFKTPPDAKVLRAGDLLWRIYFRGGRYPVDWNQFRHFGPTSSRFDHQFPPPKNQSRGILYAAGEANGVMTAIAEIFQETKVVDRHRDSPWLAGFRLERDARLLDTTGLWPIRAGGNMALNSGARVLSRMWSRRIYRSYSDMDGIWYPSSLTNQPAVALYERAGPCLPSVPHFNRALADPTILGGLSQLAASLNYSLR